MRTIGEMCAVTQRLTEFLRTFSEEASEPYRNVNAAGGDGIDVQGRNRHNLQSARRIVERDCGMIFDCIRGIGIKRLPNAEIPATVGATTTKRIRRASRRGVERIRNTRYEELGRQEQVQYNVHLSVLSSLHLMSADRTLRRLTRAQEHTDGVLPVAETLAVLRK